MLWVKFKSVGNGCQTSCHDEQRQHLHVVIETKKEKFLVADGHWRWEVDLIGQPEEEKILGRPRASNYIDSKATLKKLRLVGPRRRSLPWVAETWWDEYCGPVQHAAHKISPSFAREVAETCATPTAAHSASQQRTASCRDDKKHPSGAGLGVVVPHPTTSSGPFWLSPILLISTWLVWWAPMSPMQKWVHNIFPSKPETYHLLPERRQKVVERDRKQFE